MEVKNEFSKNEVIVLNVGENDVDGLLINWDLDDDGKYSYMENPFVENVINYLPEYAMGSHMDFSSSVNIIPQLRELSKSVIRIKNIEQIKSYLDNQTPYDKWDTNSLDIYKKKGIFSELILHFLLREMKQTTPLISKIYFKDSSAIEAHGFDSVHVLNDVLVLGESKFYSDGKQGINALIDDLNKHFCHDYLKEQFVIISRAIDNTDSKRKEWINELNNTPRLEDKFSKTIIPLLCIYEDNIAKEIIENINAGGTAEALYLDHVSSLKSFFDNKNSFPNKDRVQILLILLPVVSKDRIVDNMLNKLFYLQSI